VDKFTYKCLLQSSSWLVALTFLIFPQFAMSQENAWSFQDNPHPEYSELTKVEISAIYGYRDDNIGACKQMVTELYKVYQSRYPQFEQSGSEFKNFKNWKIYAAQIGLQRSCLSQLAWEELFGIDETEAFGGLYFCGVYSRQPITKIERRVVVLIDEMVAYAETGSEPARFYLLSANSKTQLIDLVPDIEYYFSILVIEVLKDEVDEIDVSDLILQLTPKRQKFIELAALKFDFQSVLDTIGSCSSAK